MSFLKKIAIFTLLVSLNIYASEEVPTQEEVAKLYVATFNRAPDADGLKYWTNDSGLKLSKIAQSFFDQPETKELYPSDVSNRDFVEAVYKNLFNREPDTAGWNYWENELDKGSFSKNSFIMAIINGAQNNDTSNDLDILSNKTTVGLSFAEAGLKSIEDAKNIMVGINDDNTTVDSALTSFGIDLSIEYDKKFTVNYLTGTFIDAPVQGLHYTTATQDGFTDANGNFKYKAGETVEFKLGTLSLGSVTGGSLITPYTLGDSNTTNPSNKTTNIALLLQNLDSTNDNNSTLDLSKLKGFSFSTIDLTILPATMQTNVQQLAIDIQNKLGNDYYKTNFALKDANTVKNNMKTFVEEKTKELLNVDTIIDNEYFFIEYSELTGSTDDGHKVKFTSDNKIVLVGTTDKADFDKINNTTLKMKWDEDDTEYFHFLTTTKDYATICSTRDKDASCTKPTMYLTSSSAVRDTLLNKEGIFTNPISITSLDELRGKVLYELGKSNDETFNFYAKRLESDNTITTFAWNTEATDEEFELNLDYAWTQQEGSLSINKQGKIVYSDDEDHTEGYSVKKYSLKDKTVSLNTLKNDTYGFDNSDTPDINGTVTFTNGYIYCGYIYNECWLDQDGINQFKTVFYQSN